MTFRNFLTSRLLVSLVLFVGISGCADVAQPANGASPKPPELLIVGIDGMEPSLLKEMMEAGKMPTLSKLADRGSIAMIDCVVGTISPVVWTTVATGLPPEEHGIIDFTVDDTLVTSNLRNGAALWNMLSRYDLSMATVGWMVTWPAEDDAGIIISDRAHWGRFRSKIAPRGVIDTDDYHYNGIPSSLDFLQRFTSYPYNPKFEDIPKDDPAYAVNFLLKRRLIDIFIRDQTYFEIASELLRTRSLDVLAIYFQGVDYTSHGFWKYFEPEPFREAGWEVDPEHVEQLKDIIPRYYAYIDRLLGRLVSQVSPNAQILVLSDHGFGTGLGKYKVESGMYISGNHREEGVFLLSGPEVLENLEQQGPITHFDILPTLLYELDLPQARNLHGNPLMRYFTDEAIASREVRFVNSYDPPEDGAEAPLESEHDEEIKDELRSLGYID